MDKMFHRDRGSPLVAYSLPSNLGLLINPFFNRLPEKFGALLWGSEK